MGGYLEMISEPAHVKKLTEPQLEELAREVREELISTLSRTGGHLGPNLGVVELTIAMHKIFSTPHDKFVWDVSHQCYVHKLLTGRQKGFRKAIIYISSKKIFQVVWRPTVPSELRVFWDRPAIPDFDSWQAKLLSKSSYLL